MSPTLSMACETEAHSYCPQEKVGAVQKFLLQNPVMHHIHHTALCEQCMG